jgi:hypothetical protein
VSLPQAPDFTPLSGPLVGTFTGLGVNAAGDAMRVRVTVDAAGNSTFEADVIQPSTLQMRCRAGSYQVTASGQLSFGGRVDGQLQAAGSSLVLTYTFADPDGYQSTFQVPLTRE